MQTFLPFKSFTKTARILDYRRLGKQRVEVFQILRANHEMTKGWRNHPASKMWAAHTNALVEYGLVICHEWKARGYKDTMTERIAEFQTGNTSELPEWLGDERLHSSHRASLLLKDPSHYGQFNWSESPANNYWWPTDHASELSA